MIINTPDRRTVVSDLGVRPHSATCLIQTRYAGKSDLVGFGTGFLVGPGRIATAAHVLWNDLNGEEVAPRLPSTVEIFLGLGLLDGHPQLAFTLEPDSKTARIHPKYVKGDKDYDLARMDLPQASTAPLSILGYPAGVGSGETVAVGGFPTDKAPFNHYEASGPLGKVSPSGQTIFLHQVDTGHGQSGAPVRVQRDGGWTVVGVHLGDASGSGPGQAPMNRALALTPQIVAWLLGR